MYRKQHAELVELVQTIAKNLDESALANGAAGDASELLTKLTGKLLVHLAAEDYALYPKMIKSSDSEAASTAKQYQDEMGGLKEAFQSYYAKWNGAEKIRADPATFITETQGVFKALGERVQKENTILYPLADRL
jgi:iron-sulfur cluster repair protein YtfE (RIC family)